MKLTKVEAIMKEWENINETAKWSACYEVSRVASKLSIEKGERYCITFHMSKEDLVVEIERNSKNLLPVCYVFAVYAEKMKKAIREVSKRKPKAEVSELRNWLVNFSNDYFL